MHKFTIHNYRAWETDNNKWPEATPKYFIFVYFCRCGRKVIVNDDVQPFNCAQQIKSKDKINICVNIERIHKVWRLRNAREQINLPFAPMYKRTNGWTDEHFLDYFWTRRNRKHTLIHCKVINSAIWPKLGQTIYALATKNTDSIDGLRRVTFRVECTTNSTVNHRSIIQCESCI